MRALGASLVGALFLLAGPLTLVIVLHSSFGFRLSTAIDWSYPVMQPVSRATLWIWREATRAGG